MWDSDPVFANILATAGIAGSLRDRAILVMDEAGAARHMESYVGALRTDAVAMVEALTRI